MFITFLAGPSPVSVKFRPLFACGLLGAGGGGDGGGSGGFSRVPAAAGSSGKACPPFVAFFRGMLIEER